MVRLQTRDARERPLRKQTTIENEHNLNVTEVYLLKVAPIKRKSPLASQSLLPQSGLTFPLNFFLSLRWRLSWSRFSCDPRVGRVGLRGLGGSAAAARAARSFSRQSVTFRP